MKKIISLIMAVLMLCALCVPAFAEESLDVKEDTTISGNHTYDNINVHGKDVYKGSYVDPFDPFNSTKIPCTLTIERGASITSGLFSVIDGCNVTIESGAAVTCDFFSVQAGSTVTVKSGASFTCEELSLAGGPIGDSVFAVENGASVTVSSGVKLAYLAFLDIGGTFSGKFTMLDGDVTLLPGGTVDLETANGNMANALVAQLQQYEKSAKAEQNSDGSYRVTAHRHIYAEEGICCGAEHLKNTASGSTGSTLSEGSMTVVCTVAAAVVFGLGGFILGKKKKPAAASGDNE